MMGPMCQGGVVLCVFEVPCLNLVFVYATPIGVGGIEGSAVDWVLYVRIRGLCEVFARGVVLRCVGVLSSMVPSEVQWSRVGVASVFF